MDNSNTGSYNSDMVIKNNNTHNKWAGVTLDILKEREIAIENSYNFWQNKGIEIAQKLEKESESLNPNWELCEKLQDELNIWHKRWKFEEQQAVAAFKQKEAYLTFALLSGISAMKL